MKLRTYLRASTSPLRGYAQHERLFFARPERSGAKSKDERNANFLPLPCQGEGSTSEARAGEGNGRGQFN
jgi:hypothetical protein